MLHKKPFWFGFTPALLLVIGTIAFWTIPFPGETEGEGFFALFVIMGAFAAVTVIVFILLPFKRTRPAAYGLAAPLVLAYISAAILMMPRAGMPTDYTNTLLLL